MRQAAEGREARFTGRIPRELRASLAGLGRRDNWRNWAYVCGDWLAIVAAAAGAWVTGMHPLAYAAAVVVIGSRQRALMNLQHEAVHNKLFANRRMNDLVGRVLVAFPVMAGLSAYKSSHWRHHAFLWCDRDPERGRFEALGLLEPKKSLKSFVGRHVVRPLLLTHVPYNVRTTVSFRDEERHESVSRVAFWVVAVTSAIVHGWVGWLLLFWFVPFLTSYQVIRYWAEMAEHASLATTNPWLGTRNWTSGPLARWLLASHSDDLYHLAHHLFPAIPHYRLKAAHHMLMQVPEYAGGHHCVGFFFRRSPDHPSVLDDILDPAGGRSAISRLNEAA